ncbi:MAG: ubiquitin-like domain-containing protein [Caryophanon sp.]|nr:ubiquitin-like domain-containing protein [Caryophanon sp.]
MTNYSMKNLFLRSLRKKRTLLSIVLFASIIGFVLAEGTKKVVTLQADGQVTQFTTNAHTVKEALDEMNIDVSPFDEVQPSLDTAITTRMVIDWEQAKEIEISVDQQKMNIWTTENVVKDILAEAKIDVATNDKVSHSLDANVGEEGKIDIQKAFEVTIVDGKKPVQAWATSTTVANFLNEQGVQLGELDRVESNLDDSVTPGQQIEIVRVEKVTDVVEDKMEFAVETKDDDSLLKGHKKVLQQGKEGQLSRTYEVVLENGKEVSRTLTAEKVIEQPVKEVVAFGTKVAVASVTHSSQASSEPSEGREFYVTATAYTATCNGCIGITKTGINLLKNPHLKVIAVDPNVIPLGSDVWVEGYGYAVAGDTGGAIKGNIIDLFMPEVEDAYEWGRRTVRIKVLN